MRWRGHLVGGLLLLALLALCASRAGLKPESLLAHSNGPLLVLLFLLAYLLGLLLPDADRREGDSKLYRTLFFPLAYLSRLLEYPLALILCRPIGHRQSLHTFLGVVVVSLSLPILVALALGASLTYLGLSAASGGWGSALFVPLYVACAAGLLLGQLAHLICDLHFKLY